jgi:hypothetical protein
MAETSEITVTYTPRPNATPEAELDALVSVYRFLLLEKGDRHDLSNESATEAEGANQGKKGHDSNVCC